MTSLPTSCVSSNTIPNKYVSPSQKIEGSTEKVDIPIIDLQDDSNITSQIMKASQTVGAFLVINHGIPIERMNKAMKYIEDFHNLPIEEKKKYPVESDTNKFCVFVSHNDEQMLYYGHWMDAFQVDCTRFGESIKLWPNNPKKFKEDMVENVLAVKDLSSRILDHLSDGLGLERGYLGGELSANSSLIMNHCPPSPDPQSTLGFQKHVNWSVITIHHSGHVPGLQLFKDDQWSYPEIPPAAFLVLMGSQIEVISNGKIKGALHRVTTSSQSQFSANFARFPPPDCLVEPAKDILKSENSPPHYKSFRYKDDIVEKLAGVNPKDQDVDDFLRELMAIN